MHVGWEKGAHDPLIHKRQTAQMAHVLVRFTASTGGGLIPALRTRRDRSRWLEITGIAPIVTSMEKASLSSHGSNMVMILTRRRTVLHLAAAIALAAVGRAVAQQRRFTVGFANLTDDPGARIEGLGFTGEEIRWSFVLGARGLPIELLLYDNGRERAKA